MHGTALNTPSGVHNAVYIINLLGVKPSTDLHLLLDSVRVLSLEEPRGMHCQQFPFSISPQVGRETLERFQVLETAANEILTQSERDLVAALDVRNRTCQLQAIAQTQLLQLESTLY